MDSDASGQIGGMSTSEEVRKRLARESRGWRCGGCGGRSNEEVMLELEERCREEGGAREEEKVPDELRLEFRDQLGKDKGGEKKAEDDEKEDEAREGSATTDGNMTTTSLPRETASSVAEVRTQPITRTVPSPTAVRTATQARPQTSPDTSLLDMAIVGVAIALVLMLFKVTGS